MTAFKGLGTTGDAAGVVAPLDHKLAQAAGVTKTTTPLVIRPGLFYSGSSTIVSGTAGMAYSVAAYQIVTQRSASAGVVFGGNDGALSVATTAAPGSNSRIDIVYHWHREFALDGVDSNPVIGVAQGTAAASPTAPSLAAFPGAIELARITIAAGVTATNSGPTITQAAPFTSSDTGKVPFRTTTEMNLWTTALTDQLALDLSSQITYRRSGSAWVAWNSASIAYTPTLTNVTLGTGGTNVGSYRFVAGRVIVDILITLGTGGSVGTNPIATLPVTSVALPSFIRRNGFVSLYDGSALNSFVGGALAANTTEVRFQLFNPISVSITSTNPFTWTVNDVILAQIEYEAA